MARLAIHPLGRVGSPANVYRFPRSSAAKAVADSKLFVAAPSGLSQPWGLAIEADSALALGGVQARPWGLAISDGGTALALGRVELRPWGLAISSGGTAFALGAVQLRAVSLASETDSALALGAVQARPVGMATDTGTAFALTAGAIAIPWGLAIEYDTALALGMARPVGMAIETDLALVPGMPVVIGGGSAARQWRPTFRRFAR